MFGEKNILLVSKKVKVISGFQARFINTFLMGLGGSQYSPRLRVRKSRHFLTAVDW